MSKNRTKSFENNRQQEQQTSFGITIFVFVRMFLEALYNFFKYYSESLVARCNNAFFKFDAQTTLKLIIHITRKPRLYLIPHKQGIRSLLLILKRKTFTPDVFNYIYLITLTANKEGSSSSL